MRETVKICILGDVCPDWGFRDSFRQKNREAIFGDVRDLLDDSDLSICNLECPASERGEPIKKSGPCLRGAPSDVEVLSQAGIDVLSLANNHILDFGPIALEDTFEAAKKNGMLTVGAGRDLTEAAKPLFIERKGWKIGIVNFAEHEFNVAGENTPGANMFDPYVSLPDISDAKERCDYLIAIYHGGIEHYPLPSPLLRKKCRAMADAGADIVLCQHSHCIGTKERYHDAEILYGQGNAIFGSRGNEAWDTGLIVSVQLSEAGPDVTYRAFRAGEAGIAFLPDDQNRKRLDEMGSLSDKILDDGFISESWVKFCDGIAPLDVPLLLGWGRVLNKLNRILNNLLVRIFLPASRARITMNMIRCDSHHEVVKTILEKMQR